MITRTYFANLTGQTAYFKIKSSKNTKTLKSFEIYIVSIFIKYVKNPVKVKNLRQRGQPSKATGRP